MATFLQAKAKAKELTKATGETAFVVLDPTSENVESKAYFAAKGENLDTFYLSEDVVWTTEED